MNHGMPRTLATLAWMACLGLTAPATVQAGERWFLMARQGECAEIGVLKRKVPDLGDVSDPEAFVSLMRRKGYEVTSTRIAVPKGMAREVKVPQKELSLIFVTPEMCGSHETR